MTTPDVQAELDLRTDIKPNGVAIVERGSTRHYYKKLAHGWKHISTSTDACPSFDHEQTAEQRAEALKQTQRVEEAMKKWFAAQAPKATATTIDPKSPCPAYPNGQHSYNDTKHNAKGEKFGVCKCGSEIRIPGPTKDPLYCPAHTDHRHDLRGGRCVCGETAPSFDYRHEQGVRIEIEHQIEDRLQTLSGRTIPGRRRVYVTIYMTHLIAVRDNWFPPTFTDFYLVFDNGSQPAPVRCSAYQVQEDHMQQTIRVKAEVIQ